MTDLRLLRPVEIERLVSARLKEVRSQCSKLAMTSIAIKNIKHRAVEWQSLEDIPSGLETWQLT